MRTFVKASVMAVAAAGLIGASATTASAGDWSNWSKGHHKKHHRGEGDEALIICGNQFGGDGFIDLSALTTLTGPLLGDQEAENVACITGDHNRVENED
ncbi:hypothetical protein [Streptomyces sp. NPDC051776]|uniref:hypothetical protein n=1 Tax=Streptomyces sp. NPDC051776 TaxID=3155414 RepID=UPI00342230A4